MAHKVKYLSFTITLYYVITYYPKYIKRDLTARKKYQEEIKKDNLLLDDIFILDIIRRELNKDESI